MKYTLLVLPLFLAGCTQLTGGTQINNQPLRIVIDGQSNGENMGTEIIKAAFAKRGFTNIEVRNIAVGGTTLRQHMPIGDAWADALTPRGHGLWLSTQKVLDEFRPELYIWWQGEAEASYGGPHLYSYEQDLAEFFGLIRTHCKAKIEYVVIGKQIWVGVSAAWPEGTPAWQVVRRAQEAIRMPGAIPVSDDDLKSPGDVGAVHFSQEQYAIMADRIVAAYLN